MQRTLLSLVAVGSVAATLSAQCVDPALTLQSLQTTMGGNFIYGNLTAPLYGVSQDPGPGYRCDLTLSAPISLTRIGVSLWNDGQAIATIPTPNLIGVPGCQIEMWILPGGTVTNAANYTVPYNRGTATGIPASGPDTAIGWTLAGTGNLAVAALGTASLATFPAPIAMAAGTYAVEFVLIAPYALPAGTDAIRIHPRMTSIPVSGGTLTQVDQYMTIDHSGITSPAFAAGALNHLTAPPNGPFIADIRFDYNVGPTAYSTQYGTGCYDRKKTFYQSFNGAAVPNGSAPNVTALGGISMFPLGAPVNQYLVQSTGPVYPLNGTPGSTAYYTGLGAGTPTHANSVAAAVGGPGWDDGNTVLYTLPFPLNHPGGVATQVSMCSNGIVYAGTTAGSRFFYDAFAGILNSPGASWAAGFGDYWPIDGTGATAGGTGDMFVDSDGATYVTFSWVNVQEYNGTANFTTGNNFQIQFDISGQVTFAWGSLRNSDTAPVYIGYSEGNLGAGAAPDPGAGQGSPRAAVPQAGGGVGSYTTGLPFLSGDGAKPAVISLGNRPKHGANLVVNVDNLDPTVQAVLTFISATSLPGIDLGTLLNMPGCSAYILLPEIVSGLNLTLGAPSLSVNFGTIPPVGPVSVYAQAAGLSTSVPAFNTPNILLSNAVCIHIDAN